MGMNAQGHPLTDACDHEDGVTCVACYREPYQLEAEQERARAEADREQVQVLHEALAEQQRLHIDGLNAVMVERDAAIALGKRLALTLEGYWLGTQDRRAERAVDAVLADARKDGWLPE